MHARARIRERITKLDAIYRTYREYAQQRLEEEDLHGLWDVGVNMSENRCERAGWQGAMDELDQVDVPQLHDYPAQPGGVEAYLRDGGDPSRLSAAWQDASTPRKEPNGTG
jgi:hypothetical protein